MCCSIHHFIPNAAASYDFETRQQQSEIAKTMGFKPDIKSTFGRGGGWHEVCALNALGYIPVVSTVTGVYRTLTSLAYSVKCLGRAIFDRNSRAEHKKEGLKIGMANIGRGLLETIPVVGNLFTYNIDASRMMHRWSDYSYRPYGDPRSIQQFQYLDCYNAIPGVGTIVGAVRVVFFTTHALVNIPPALSCDARYCRAIDFSIRQIGTGLVSMIPIIGTIYLCYNGTCWYGMDCHGGYDDDWG